MLQLILDAYKRYCDTDREKQVSWQTLPSDAPVQPGDIIRYVQFLNFSSERRVKNLVLTQPIPPKTVYILNSATGQGSDYLQPAAKHTAPVQKLKCGNPTAGW